MAFSPNDPGKPGSAFASLSHLLEDFENYLRHVGGHNPRWQPKFDLFETLDAYELYGELPGMTGEKVSVEFAESQTLLVHGTAGRAHTANIDNAALKHDVDLGAEARKGETSQGGGRRCWLRERNTGEFSRSFHFPSQIDQEAVKADLKDGILTIILPKCAKKEARRVPVR